MSEPSLQSPLDNAFWTACVLATTGGFVDTAGFIGLDGMFCAHVTGNLVMVGSRLGLADSSDAFVRLSVLPIFALSTALTLLFIRSRGRRGCNVLSAGLFVEAAALTAFAAVSMCLVPTRGGVDDATQMISGSFGVVAMAIQSTLMRECLPQFAPTTVMTGNITQGVADAVRFCLGDRSPILRQRAVRIGLALGGFVLGSVVAAYGMHRFGFICLALPVVAIAALALKEHRAPTLLPSLGITTA